eukprot:g4062.t1
MKQMLEAVGNHQGQKQHTVVLQGAVHTLKHTLVPVPTTNADGFLHFGDMLMLQNACTRGLLQVDAMETTVDTGSAEVTGYGLSTGRLMKLCTNDLIIFLQPQVAPKKRAKSAFVHEQLRDRIGACAKSMPKVATTPGLNKLFDSVYT